MNITILSSSDYECEFLLKDSSGPIANALRKVMMNEIPILAIDKIEEIKNTSVLTNEQIIQRLNFIPIVSNSEKALNLELHDKCKCDKECEKCSIPFSISVENNSNKNKTVYADDIKIEESNLGVKVFKEGKYSIPITKLAPGQTLIVKGFIKKGLGKQHSKWIPTGTVFYKFMPVVKVNDSKSLSFDEREKLISICPTKVFSLKSSLSSSSSLVTKNNDKKKKLSVATPNSVVDIESLQIDPTKCTMCNECVYHFPKNAEVGYTSDEIIFSVESVGSLRVDKIVNDSLEFLKSI
jgi:DNA-directed RNA polymerase alpha subunit